ncbi:MAG: hypothetical protein ACRC9K_23635 [Afipia sp.]
MKMNIRTIFGLAAVAGLLAVAAPADRAQAVSLINPAASTSAKQASENITEVHWRRHHGWHRHHGWRRHHGWHHRRHWHHRHHWHRRHHWY